MCTSESNFLGSTSLDRYFRLHSTPPPPILVNSNLDTRGEVLGSVYMNTIPTAVVAVPPATLRHDGEKSSRLVEDEDGEDVWEGMQDAGDSDDEESRKRVREA